MSGTVNPSSELFMSLSRGGHLVLVLGILLSVFLSISYVQ